MDIFAKDQPMHFGELHYPNGGHYGPLHGPNFTVTVLLEGEIKINMDGQWHNFTTGQTICCFSENLIEYQYPKKIMSHVLWCEVFDFQPTHSIKEELKNLPRTAPVSERLLSLLKLGLDTEATDHTRVKQMRSTFGKLCFEEYFLLADIEEEDEEALPTAILHTKRYIETHYMEPCNSDTFAQVSELNPRYLLRTFRKHIGVTPTQYLWQLRTEKGTYLLSHSGLSIAEVAYHSGFQNQFHFSRYIKKRYGLSPSALRKRVWYRDLETINQNIEHEIYEQ